MRYYEYMLQKGREMAKVKEFEVGDRVKNVGSGYTKELGPNKGQYVDYGTVVNLLDGALHGGLEVAFDDTFGEALYCDEGNVEHVLTAPVSGKTDSVEGVSLTGGPAKYYDLPYKEWDTTNDMGEYLAKKRWKEYSLHFKDILKALVRFGAKGGTTQQYDIEKIIYSGCRAMIMLSGKTETRDYLNKLLDDPQFKESNDD